MASLARTILEEHLVRGELVPGQEIAIAVDQALAQDATGTMAMMQFELFGHDRVEVDTAVVYVDHNILQIDFKNPDDHRFLQSMAAKYGAWFSRPGNGICHYIHCERFAVPGKTLVGADSHTTQSGLGRDDRDRRGRARRGGLHGRAPLRAAVPEDRRRLPRERAPAALDPGEGRDPRAAPAARRSRRPRRDLRVHRPRGDDAELHRARDDREHDRRARGDRRRLPGRRRDEGAGSRSRSAATTSSALETGNSEDDFDEVEHIDLAALVPLVAKPSSPGNVVPVDELVGTELAQVCVGSSVNSSYEDMAVVGATLRGSQISEKLVSATATPGSRQILDQITQSGTYVDLLSAGVRMLEPACGPCVGMGQAPPSGANSLRTFNRNFPGRSGTADDQVYLCSPGGRGGLDAEGRDLRPARVRRARAAGSGRPRGRPSSRRTSSRRRRRTRPLRSRSRAARTSSRRLSRRSFRTRSSCAC